MGHLSKAKFPKEVRLFISQVESYIAQLDVVMKSPDSYERGQKIAKLSNELEMAKDVLSHFGIKQKKAAPQKLTDLKSDGICISGEEK